ncbi:hypothetical protein FXO37_04626 [Capsicum annuum]|nr:hypothetical protein FXO37_04626 [Capsicum annuum]
MYPLCITTRDKSTEDREFDVETGAMMCVERTESDAATLYCLDEILTLNGVKTSRMTVKPASEYHYSFYESGRIYVVDLNANKCNWGRFQIDKISCSHAIVVLKSKHITKFCPWCSDEYKPATLVKTYEVPVVLMPNKAIMKGY